MLVLLHMLVMMQHPTLLRVLILMPLQILYGLKHRDQSEKNILHDTVRGVGNTLYSTSDSAADTGSTYSDRYKSFDFDGFTVGSTHTSTNSDGDDFVAWCWKAEINKTPLMLMIRVLQLLLRQD